MASMEEILHKKSSEIESPKAYPVGVYHCMIDGPPTPGKSSQKGTEFLQFKFKILSMVNGDAAEAAEQQIIGKTITNDYYIKDGVTWRLKDMLVNDLGIEPHEGTPNEKELIEMVNEAQGKQILVTLKHETAQDGKRVFHRVHSTAHV